VLTHADHTRGKGGCPLGSLGGQLAENDPDARAGVAAGFGRWSTAIRDGLRALHTAGHLAPEINPDDLAVTLLAALQGGLLLAQVQRDNPSPANHSRHAVRARIRNVNPTRAGTNAREKFYLLRDIIRVQDFQTTN